VVLTFVSRQSAFLRTPKTAVNGFHQFLLGAAMNKLAPEFSSASARESTSGTCELFNKHTIKEVHREGDTVVTVLTAFVSPMEITIFGFTEPDDSGKPRHSGIVMLTPSRMGNPDTFFELQQKLVDMGGKVPPAPIPPTYRRPRWYEGKPH
jgi:hypothetical protein